MNAFESAAIVPSEMDYFSSRRDSDYSGVSVGVVDAGGDLLECDTAIDAEKQYFCYWNDDKPPNCDFLQSIANPIVLSERAFLLLRKFRMPPEVECGEVTILAEVDGPSMCKARMIHFRDVARHVMDCDDETAYLKNDFIDRARGIARPPVVRRESVEPFDLLQTLTTGMLYSASLKAAIEREGLTGVRFLPVEVK
jgi:hypothetical protein